LAHVTPRSPAVFLFGPTAVGKTNLLEHLTPHLYEVVSADSLQVYRRLDIGTAKPSPDELARIPHHLIDIIDPVEQFDVGEFVRLADIAVGDIWSRGRVPLVSGGAGFYLKQLLYGLPQVPASNPGIRAQVQADLEKLGLPTLFERLSAVDPVTAGRVGPTDAYRITRALEVFESSGTPLSDFPLPSTPRPSLGVKLIGLERPRPELHARIAARVEGMISGGLREEVEGLVADGYRPDNPGLRGIGYQEFFDNHGNLRPPEEDNDISDRIARDTRRYAKRQITFFRGLPEVHWFSADAVAEVTDTINHFAETVRRGLLDS
jgi:tRNA dimethylallyltransferase